MLSIYNENNTPWSLETINESSSRLSSTVKYKTKDDKEFSKSIGINITGENVFADDLNLADIIETTNPVTIMTGTTNTSFRKKDCRPYITTGVKYNKDILFITIKLNGSTITDISAPVLEHYIACGCICMIVATNGSFTVTLHNEKNKIDRIYSFTQMEDKTFDLTIAEQKSNDEEYMMYNIKKYRPRKPTYVIFSHVKDLDALKKIEKLNLDYYKVVTFSNKDEFYSAIDTVINEKYSAATLFANAKETTGDAFKIYKNNYNALRTKFKVFNVLLSDGKILKR